MRLLKIWGSLFCLLLVLQASAQQEKYSRVKVYVSSPEEKAMLVGLLQVDHLYEEAGAIISEISATAVNKLKASRIKHTILVDDVVKRLEDLNRRYYEDLARGIDPNKRVALEQNGRSVDDIIVKPAAFGVKSTFGGYYSFSEMVTAMNELVAAYPSIASKTSIGKTYENRDIWVIKISDNVASDETGEPEVLYMGQQHAREAITGISMIFFMQYLCENYATDPKIKSLVSSRELYIIPCFNPDGWEYNRTSMGGAAGGQWRKNRSATGATTRGVDLNRNWGVDWGNCSAPILGSPTSCGTSDKTADTYYGSGAFSELETQAVRQFTKEHHFIAGFDQHAFGPYYSLPFGRKSLGHDMPLKGQQFYTAVPAIMGTYNGMRAADSYDALGYEVAGGFKDWMLMGEIGSSLGSGLKDTVWAMTGEGGAGGGTSAGSFWAPASEIISLCKGMCYQNLQLAIAAGTYVDIQDATPISLTAKSGDMKFRIRRIGLGNEPVTVSLVPIENLETPATSVTVNNMVYYDTYSGSIPYTLAATTLAGHRVKFAWKVTAGGYTYYDTIVKFLSPVEVFFDDMEGAFSDNWTNTATGVASGLGYTYTAGSFVFTTGGYTGKALSESAAGTKYTRTSIRIAQCKTIMNLSDASEAYLSFWTRHKAENFRDKLQVQVSANGITWEALSGSTTIQEPGLLDGSTINSEPSLTGIRDTWTHEVFNLGAYAGVGTLRLRFVFTSDNDPSSFAFELDEGFFIDDVRVIKTAPMLLIPLAVMIRDFDARSLPDKTVALQWSTAMDEKGDHFALQRSADGLRFQTIHEGEQLSEHAHQDLQPFDGYNFYRVVYTDSRGGASYTPVVAVFVDHPVEVRTYPNPVTDQLQLKFTAGRAETFSIDVSDLQGRRIFQKQVHLPAGETVFNINVRPWFQRLYVLKVRNSRNEVVATQKISKL